MTEDERIEPQHAALVVIDVQNDFCDPAGSCAAVGHDVTGAVAMAPRLERLIDGARRVGVPVVWVRTEHHATTDSPAWLGRWGDPAGQQKAGSTCRRGTWGAEFFHVAPAADEPIVRKFRYGAFLGTSMDTVIRTLGRASLLFTGVATNACVESSLREALSLNYHVSLVEDCCAAFEQHFHDATVRNVAGYFGAVLSSEWILDRWE